eukprot:jgi/Bigna1/77444/fgenesh1_pg.48_\
MTMTNPQSWGGDSAIIRGMAFWERSKMTKNTTKTIDMVIMGTFGENSINRRMIKRLGEAVRHLLTESSTSSPQSLQILKTYVTDNNMSSARPSGDNCYKKLLVVNVDAGFSPDNENKCVADACSSDKQAIVMMVKITMITILGEMAVIAVLMKATSKNENDHGFWRYRVRKLQEALLNLPPTSYAVVLDSLDVLMLKGPREMMSQYLKSIGEGGAPPLLTNMSSSTVVYGAESLCDTASCRGNLTDKSTMMRRSSPTSRSKFLNAGQAIGKSHSIARLYGKILRVMKRKDIDDQAALVECWLKDESLIKLDYEGHIFATIPPFLGEFWQSWNAEERGITHKTSRQAPCTAHFAGMRLQHTEKNKDNWNNPCQMFLYSMYQQIGGGEKSKKTEMIDELLESAGRFGRGNGEITREAYERMRLTDLRGLLDATLIEPTLLELHLQGGRKGERDDKISGSIGAMLRSEDLQANRRLVVALMAHSHATAAAGNIQRDIEEALQGIESQSIAADKIYVLRTKKKESSTTDRRDDGDGTTSWLREGGRSKGTARNQTNIVVIWEDGNSFLSILGIGAVLEGRRTLERLVRQALIWPYAAYGYEGWLIREPQSDKNARKRGELFSLKKVSNDKRAYNQRAVAVDSLSSSATPVIYLRSFFDEGVRAMTDECKANADIWTSVHLARRGGKSLGIFKL